MAKAVGLDAGEYEVKLVELDGSYRKTRLSKIIVERVEQDDAGADDALHASRGAMAALRAFKEANANRDNITLGFPAREAVFRRLTVPFTGREQIRKVIKFEVEGSIHSHNVDDMVVDFHTVTQEGGEPCMSGPSSIGCGELRGSRGWPGRRRSDHNPRIDSPSHNEG